jgi:hypothetical protein
MNLSTSAAAPSLDMSREHEDETISVNAAYSAQTRAQRAHNKIREKENTFHHPRTEIYFTTFYEIVLLK